MPDAQRHVSHGSFCEETRRPRRDRRGQSAALRTLDFGPVRAADSRSATRPLRTRKSDTRQGRLVLREGPTRTGRAAHPAATLRLF